MARIEKSGIEQVREYARGRFGAAANHKTPRARMTLPRRGRKQARARVRFTPRLAVVLTAGAVGGVGVAALATYLTRTITARLAARTQQTPEETTETFLVEEEIIEGPAVFATKK